MSHHCDRYSLMDLLGVEFCRKAGARIVGEKLADLKARAEKAERAIKEHWKPHLETVRRKETEMRYQRDKLSHDLAAAQAREHAAKHEVVEVKGSLLATEALLADARRTTLLDAAKHFEGAQLEALSATGAVLAVDAQLGPQIAAALRALSSERDEARRVFNESMDKRRELIDTCAGLEKALAAAQARERELRATIQAVCALPEGSIAEGNGGRHWRAVVASIDALTAALSAPQDTTALRALLLEVATRAVDSCPPAAPSEIVTAMLKGMLKGDGHPLADAFEANAGPPGKQLEGDPEGPTDP